MVCILQKNFDDFKLFQGVGVIEISGKAAPAVFQSKPSGYEPNNYLIEWTAVSHTPVFKFELLYR